MSDPIKEFEVVGKPKSANATDMVLRRFATHEEAVEHALTVNMSYWEDVWVRRRGDDSASKAEPVEPAAPLPNRAPPAPTPINIKAEIAALKPTMATEHEEADFTVVAANPQEMAGAQRSMILWAARKIQAEKELLRDAQDQIAIAAKSGWATQGWYRRLQISEDKINYYKKIKLALEAGYYIVPPFPIDVFAIRTVQKKPNTRSGWIDANHARRQGIDRKPVPAGDGEYVANEMITRPFTSTREDPITKERKPQVYHAPHRFKVVEFPFKLAKSAVMSETSRAMALKVFDQIGIMGTAAQQQQAKKRAVPDPIVCGQILPWVHNRQPVTFFVAWWLDTSTL